jgi:hypothetical protein
MKKRPPEKTCGECDACCVDLKIDTPEFRKKAGVTCPHLAGTGCGIYATRPKVCQEFLCGWRLLPELGPEWRPDRSGVLIVLQAQKTLPEKYQAAGNGQVLMIRSGEAAINRPGFARYVGGLLSRGVAVYMAAASPKTLVNDYIDAEIAAKDLPGLTRMLLHLHGLLHASRWKQGWLAMLPHLYRLQVERLRFQASKRLNNSNS